MNSTTKVGLKNAKNQKDTLTITGGNGRQGKPTSPRMNVQMNRRRAPKSQKMEPLVKEEGEMSDNEVYEQFKEVKWREWCDDVMVDEENTLKRLQKLQSTSAVLPKEKVLSKIRNYLQLIGRRVDQIVAEYEQESYRQERMTTRLWNYVSTFSNMSGERLQQIYTKLKQEQGVGPSHLNGSAIGQTAAFIHRDLNVEKFEAWKRKKRAEADSSHIQHPYQRPPYNGTWLPDTGTSGILGPPPSDSSRQGRPYLMQQSRQGFSSVIK